MLFRLAMIVMLSVALLPAQVFANERYASIVIDAESGEILRARNADKPLRPASLVKMMTLYMTFDAIKAGKMTMETPLPVSAFAAGQSPTKLGLRAGQTIRVRDAVLGLITKSANDAAVVLAEAIGGSESNFAAQMTSKAKRLGMSRTTFRNASGLPNNGQFSTVKDMAQLSRALMVHHPEFYHLFSTRSFTYRGVAHRNHNRLMSEYAGMDGLKTGFTNASGFNLAASARREGRRVIGVVFGGRSWKSRNDHMAALLDEGFAMLRSGQRPAMVALNDSNASAEADDKPVVRAARPEAKPAAAIRTASASYSLIRPANAAERSTVQRSGNNGRWAIQVGAFGSREGANKALKTARRKVPNLLASAAARTVRSGRIHQARFTGLSSRGASQACRAIKARGGDCMVMAPG